MKNKMMEQDVENMGIMAGFKDMMEMEDDDMEDMNEEDRVASEVMGRSPKSPEILMNNLRGDMRSVEARIDELADMVGYRAAKDTPQEVLALLQPVLAQQQGIGAAPASAELMQGPQPPMAPPPEMAPPGMPPMMPPGAPPEAAPGGMPPEMMAALMGGAGGPQGMAGPPPPETGGIAGAPPMAMARGGYVQNFQAGSTEDGVTPDDETVLGEREEPLFQYPADIIVAAKEGMVDLLQRRPAVVPDLGALARGREPAYRTILGDTKGASQAQMLMSLGQRAFNFGANVDDQGRPLRGSFVSRLSGAVRTLPQDMMARVAEIDKGERAIKMAALQASEKDIDQIQAANSELTKQKRAFYGDVVRAQSRVDAAEARERAKEPKNPLGAGFAAGAIKIFSTMAPDYAAGNLTPEQDRFFLGTVNEYVQPRERSEPRPNPKTGEIEYVTIMTRPELPDYVVTALGLRGKPVPSAQAPSNKPGAGKPTLAAPGQTDKVPGAVSSAAPAKSSAEPEGMTLWNQRFLTPGIAQNLKTLRPVRILGQLSPEADAANAFFMKAKNNLVKVLSINPRFPVAEMERIQKEVDIEPAFFDNAESLSTRLLVIDKFLRERLKDAQRDSMNKEYTMETKKFALDEEKELKNFLKILGVPQISAYTLEEVEALPSGTDFLWNGTVGRRKK